MNEHERRVEALERTEKRVGSSKKAAREFLMKAGIIDENGELAKMYRND